MLCQVFAAILLVGGSPCSIYTCKVCIVYGFFLSLLHSDDTLLLRMISIVKLLSPCILGFQCLKFGEL